jgi:uncharacterized protein (DUF1800 family)
MLLYLDNARSTRDALNENYARELMELHTLGVSGGYTQRDVQEVARCFTGWSFLEGGSWQRGEFVFRPEEHDDGSRRVLGVTLPAGLGRRHGERVLEILTDHPATARFIARKLCRRFIADEGAAPPDLVARLAASFRRTGGDIAQVLGILLRSDEFRRGRARKLKRPFDFAISALRALDAETDAQGVLPHLRRMGQPPYQWAMPNGYPDRVEAWLPSLLGRWNFALELATGRIDGTAVDLERAARHSGEQDPARQALALQAIILGHTRPVLEDTHLHSLLQPAERGAPQSGHTLAQNVALLLMSPAFQWR